MKKNIIAFITTAVFATSAVYFFIPKNIRVSSEIVSACGIGSAQRISSSSFYRAKWLPATGTIISATEYELDGCRYRFGTDNAYNNSINIQYKNISTNSLLTLLPAGKDSLAIKWMLNEESNYNPLGRVSLYFKLKHIKETNEKILHGMSQFLSTKKNIYGFDVQLKKQTDSTLITLKGSFDHYPAIADIYEDIEKLRAYADANHAKTTNAPMLNIGRVDLVNWQYMVALAIDKPLDNYGKIIAKRMFAGGKILITENINGGFAAVDDALLQFEKFKTDYNYMSPAIPFQSLITDRAKEPDSSKWITRLYYPVY